MSDLKATSIAEAVAAANLEATNRGFRLDDYFLKVVEGVDRWTIEYRAREEIFFGHELIVVYDTKERKIQSAREE